MGLFDFITGAGKKLPDPAAQPPGSAASDEARAKFNAARAAGLAKLVKEHGFDVPNLKVEIDGERVTLSGDVASQEVREKVVLLVGNTWGTGKVDDRLRVTAPPAPAAKLYTVVKGDTLSKIAKEQYGKAGLYTKIFEANRPMLSDPDKIYPGQVRRSPPAA